MDSPLALEIILELKRLASWIPVGKFVSCGHSSKPRQLLLVSQAAAFRGTNLLLPRGRLWKCCCVDKAGGGGVRLRFPEDWGSAFSTHLQPGLCPRATVLCCSLATKNTGNWGWAPSDVWLRMWKVLLPWPKVENFSKPFVNCIPKAFAKWIAAAAAPRKIQRSFSLCNVNTCPTNTFPKKASGWWLPAKGPEQ